MPEDAGWVMDKAFSTPIIDPDRGQPYTFISGREIQGDQLVPKAGHILHFHKDHGIVYPIFDIGILQVKSQTLRLEIGHAGRQDTFLKSQITVEASRKCKVPGAYEWPDGSSFMFHLVFY